MKKSLIALAVAGALTAPMVAQADATLYGSLRIKLMDNDAENLQMADNVSRIGIRGSSDLFSGAKAIFQFEQGVNTEEGKFGSGRLSNIGMTGDFGTALFGRMWIPHYNWTVAKTDILDNSTSGGGSVVSGRQGNVVAYVSPNMNGLQAAAAVITDADADDDNVDIAHVAANYEMNGLTVGASYVDIEGDAGAGEEQVIAVAASYTMGDLYVAARYEDRDEANTDNVDVVASYTIGNTTLLANYIKNETASGDVKQHSVEVQQKLGAQARVFAALADYDGAEDTGFEVGYRVDF